MAARTPEEVRSLIGLLRHQKPNLGMSDEVVASVVAAIDAGAMGDPNDWLPPLSVAFPVNIQSYDTLLKLVAQFEIAPLVAALLRNGADPDRGLVASAPERQARSTTSTPLAMTSSIDCARMLLEAGATVDHRDPWRGRTKLFAARTVPMVELLLAHGADPFLEDHDGQTALAAARQEGRHEVAAALRAAMLPRLEPKPSVACSRGRKWLPPGEARGVRAFIGQDEQWYVLGLRAEPDRVASALADMPGAKSRELAAHQRPVVDDGHHCQLVIRFTHGPWTLVVPSYLVGGFSDRFAHETFAADLSAQLGGTDMFSFTGGAGPMLAAFRDGTKLEEHFWFAEAHPEDDDEELLRQMDGWFEPREVFIPKVRLGSDGLVLRVGIVGVRREHVEHADVIVLDAMR